MNIDGYRFGPQVNRTTTIILFIVLVFCLASLKTVIDLKSSEEKNDFINDIINIAEDSSIDEQSIITNSIASKRLYYIDALNKTIVDFNTLNNQAKLQIGILPFEDVNVSASDVQTYLLNVYGSDFTLKNEDVLSFDDASIMYRYDDEEYLLDTENVSGLIYSEFNNVINFSKKDDIFELTVTKMFFDHSVELLSNFYSNYNDCLGQVNPLFSIEDVEFELGKSVTNTTQIWDYYKKHYFEFNINTKYKYTFVKKDDNFLLTKYEILI